MSDSSQQILLELPAPLLKKLGNAPAKKILELVEKFVEAKNSVGTESRNANEIRKSFPNQSKS